MEAGSSFIREADGESNEKQKSRANERHSVLAAEIHFGEDTEMVRGKDT